MCMSTTWTLFCLQATSAIRTRPSGHVAATHIPSRSKRRLIQHESLLFNSRPSKMKALNSFETYGATPVPGRTECSATPTWKSQNSPRPRNITITVTFIEIIKHHHNVGSNTSFNYISALNCYESSGYSLLYAMCKQNRELQYRVWFLVATILVLCLSSLLVQESSVAWPNTRGDRCCMSMRLKHIDPRAGVCVALRRCSWTSVKKRRQCCSLCQAVALAWASS